MTTRAPTTWLYWTITALSLLWNAAGAFDYVMTNTRNAEYLADAPAATIDALDAMPPWAIVAWTLGVAGAVLGSLLLLARSRLAVPAFIVSLAGLAATTGYRMARGQLAGSRVLAITALIAAAAVFLLWYAGKMRRTGVLR